MAINELITSANDARNRSAYPSLTQPQRRDDGYVLRFRVHGDCLTPQQLRALVGLLRAQRTNFGITGYGEVELSAIAETQMPAVVAWITDNLPIETALGVTAFPSPRSDALVVALKSGAADLVERLSPALRVVVDTDGSLAALPADLRLIAHQSDRWSVTLGGGKPQLLDFDTAISTSLALLSALAALGPEAGAADLFVPYGAPEFSAEPKTKPVALSELLDLCDTAETQSGTVNILPLAGLQISR